MINPNTRPYSPQELQQLFRSDVIVTQRMPDVIVEQTQSSALPTMSLGSSKFQSHYKTILAASLLAFSVILIITIIRKKRSQENNKY